MSKTRRFIGTPTDRPATPNFERTPLMPAIAQDAVSGEVLMLAWVDQEAWKASMETGFAHYHSRSRNALWKKGESSGHVQEIVETRVDCDEDAILYIVNQTGAACHTGERTCFYREGQAPQ